MEHDPREIWSSQLEVARAALAKAGVKADEIAAIGITNQRETTILWERESGRPVANAIVWQSRVSAYICEQLKAQGLEEKIRAKTGLVLDAYFSASKIKHMLDQNPELRNKAQRGQILFGTVETFLIWRLTGGKRHITDVSNASRTMLLNIHTRQWDQELLEIFGVPRAMLPEVVPNMELDAQTDTALFGAPIRIGAAAGDQQAAMFGQACHQPGMAKNTYGTGCFALLNTGLTPVHSANGLLTTIGWQHRDETVYCLEGAVFIAGAVVQWMRDGLRAIAKSVEIEALAGAVADNGGVYFVPAFVGLGAPYWDPYARGTIVGLTRDTKLEHIARAAIEAIAFQTRDVLDLMHRESGVQITELRVDGGAAANNQLMQFQADLLGVAIRRPRGVETTALGAAVMAGLAAGFWASVEEFAANLKLDREFTPKVSPAKMDLLYKDWQRAVERSRAWVAS